MKKLRLKNNNTGMTLVELLVAIGIFTAAIIPMLYAFVYSTGFNFKAQQTMQSTGIAQAIIEKCKGANTNTDTLAANLSNGNILKEFNNFDVGSVSDDGTTFKLYNVKPKNSDGTDVNDAVDNGNSSRRAYDVKVILTPQDEAITDYSVPHTMRSGLTANFLLVDDLKDQDQAFQAAFMEHLKQTISDNIVISPAPSTQAVKDSIVNYIFDDYDIQNLLLERIITITADDTEVIVNVDYAYLKYDGATNLPTRSFSRNFGGTTYSISLNATPNASLDPAASYFVAPYEHTLLTGSRAASVYFYYYPAYASSAGRDGTNGTSDDMSGFQDHFILKNDMTQDYLGNNDPADPNCRLDFYLFKQYPVPDGTNPDWVGSYNVSDIETLDGDYKATIDMESTAPFRTNLYHNLLWNLNTGDEVPAASYPTVTEGAGCYNRTVVVTADPDNLSDRVSGSAEDVTQHFREAFYVYYNKPGDSASGVVTGYEHDSYILEDRAVVPYASEKTGIALAGRFGARYHIKVVVFPHGADMDNDDNAIEIMESDFLNW